MNTLTPQQKLDILTASSVKPMKVRQESMCTCCGVVSKAYMASYQNRLFLQVDNGDTIAQPEKSCSILVPDEELNVLIEWDDV